MKNTATPRSKPARAGTGKGPAKKPKARKAAAEPRSRESISDSHTKARKADNRARATLYGDPDKKLSRYYRAKAGAYLTKKAGKTVKSRAAEKARNKKKATGKGRGGGGGGGQ